MAYRVGYAPLGRQDSSFKPATGVFAEGGFGIEPPRPGARAERLEAADAVEKVGETSSNFSPIKRARTRARWSGGFPRFRGYSLGF